MRRARTTSLLSLFIACWLVVAAAASASLREEARGAMDGDEPRVHARLMVDRDEDAGSASVGIRFAMDPGWHLYWRNPGDSGLAPKLRFAFEGGEAEVGEVAWPAPRAFAEDVDIVTYGYEGEVLLAAPVHWTPALGAPDVVRVNADVLVCAEQCIPASFELARPFTTEPAIRDQVAARFERAALRVPPAAQERGVDVSLEWPSGGASPGEEIRAALAVDACAGGSDCGLRAEQTASASFFPYAPDTLMLRPVAVDGDGPRFRIALAGEAFETIGEDALLRGVLALRQQDGEVRSFEVALPLSQAAPAGGAAAADLGAAALLRALVLGLLGGLLLNLMPCVLPVLAIKVCAVAELAQRSRGEVVGHAVAYTLGILATLLSLALCVLALRWSGTAVGWGFHLQEPVFVAVVAAVLVAFAMNLLGAFEFEVVAAGLGALGAQAVGYRRSFFDGLLAVVLATPCSAPFLGTAVGFAFASGAPVIIAIFLSIGLGLALPFIAVAIVPGWSRWMPRSGPWMLELRRGLGFALLATVVWLLWIVGRSAGADAMAALMMLLLVIAFSAWLFGLIQRTRHTHASFLVAAIAVLLVAGLDLVDFEAAPQAADVATADAPGAPLAYSRDALGEVLAEGRPAFVYFTADWCLTCKLNERRVLAHPEAQQALRDGGFSVLRADWTRRDETIRRELAALGKAGVPVYAIYRPDGPDQPQLLPELLMLEPFLNALAETAEEVRTASVPAGSPVR